MFNLSVCVILYNHFLSKHLIEHKNLLEFDSSLNLLIYVNFGSSFVALAERQGFEPWIRHKRMPDFESGAFDHSAIFPNYKCRQASDCSKDQIGLVACFFSKLRLESLIKLTLFTLYVEYI